jgi:hypothetical protein
MDIDSIHCHWFEGSRIQGGKGSGERPFLIVSYSNPQTLDPLNPVLIYLLRVTRRSNREAEVQDFFTD